MPSNLAEGNEPQLLEVRELGLVPYLEALELQRTLVEQRRSGILPDQLLLLEHPHVITLGTGSNRSHVLADSERRAVLGVELVETARGGDVTYHGPGQLVGYPILDLKPDRQDLHRYLRDLEEVILRFLSSLSISAFRSPGFTGVWTDQGKVAAIGVRVSSGWITSHGFALNVNTRLEYFETIVPCGLSAKPVTSLDVLLGREVSMSEVRAGIASEMGRVFGRRIVERLPGS